MTNIVKKKLPHGAISFVNVKDANVKSVIMQLNENILSLKTQLETAQNALIEVQSGHVVTTSGGGSFTIKGYYNTYAELVASVTNPRAGDAYAVGTSAPYHVYVFDGNSQTWKDNGVITGIDGGYYTPSVSAAGNITWTASKDGMPAIAQQNIKGPSGNAATVGVHSTVTGAAGTEAIVENKGTQSAANFKFTIPSGEKGDSGPANTLSIGTVQSGIAADATITGTSPNQTLNLVLPMGEKGDRGDAGPATISVGSTITGDPGTQASVVNVGTSSDAVLKFTIPRGAEGAGGASASASVSRTFPDTSGNRTTTITCQTGSLTPTTATITSPDIQIVASLPESPVSGTIYFVTGS